MRLPIGYWTAKVNPWLRYFWKFFLRDIQRRYTWLEWVLPFQILNLAIGLASWILYATTLGGRAELVSEVYGGNFYSYLILGMAFNGLLSYSLNAYYDAYLIAISGSFGIHGQRVSMLDYVFLSGIPSSAFLGGWVIWGYLENLINLGIYLACGYAIFGVWIPANANWLCAVIVLILGILATSGIGLISASMIWIVRTWRGTEPIRWAISILASLASGVYFPPEVFRGTLLYTVAYSLPQTYALKAARLAILNGFGFGQLWDSIALLSIYAIFLPFMGALVLRYSIGLSRKRPLID